MAVSKYANVWEVAKHFGYSDGWVIRELRLLGIKAKPGFFSPKGNTRGRQPGFLQSEAHREKLRVWRMNNPPPMLGKKHSKEAKHKMSRNHADFSGDANPFKRSLEDPAKREAHKIRCKEIWAGRDEKWREEFGYRTSLRMKNALPTRSRGHKQGVHISDKGGTFTFRSSWEQDAAELLDHHELVETYQYEGEGIPYEDHETGRWRHLRFDFVIRTRSGQQAIIEIKPKALIAYKFSTLIAQYEYAVLHGIQFVLVGKDELYQEGSFDDIIKRIDRGEYYAVSPERCGLVLA